MTSNLMKYSEDIIKIGKSWDAEGLFPEVLPEVPRAYFELLGKSRGKEFEFLAESDFERAFCFIKGLVACEMRQMSPYGGSVSLVISAFSVIRSRLKSEWAVIADWIVQNHPNPWSPFNFRKAREQWESARLEVADPVEIALRASELEREYDERKCITRDRQIIREHIQKLGKESPPSLESIRQQIVEELEREAGWPELRE
jgi:hypothetical protein